MLETSEGFLCISEHHMGVKSKEVRWSDGLVGGGGSDGDAFAHSHLGPPLTCIMYKLLLINERALVESSRLVMPYL